MAVELVVGAGIGLAFTVLYDAVKEGMIGKFTKFTPLLGALRSTLDSIQPLVITQIGQLNEKLDLPNDEVKQLESQLWKGKNLVLKLSKLSWWNPTKSSYTDQLLRLDGSLKMLLNQLQMQQSRDIKMNLLVAQQTTQQLAEYQGRVEGLMNERTLLEEKTREFQNKLLLVMEDSRTQVHGLQTVLQTMMKQYEPKDDESNGGILEGLKKLLELMHGDLLILSAENIPYKPVLESMRKNIASIYNWMKVMEGGPDNESKVTLLEEELENLGRKLQEGVKLLRGSSKLSTWNLLEKVTYTNKLIKWDASLSRQFVSCLQHQYRGNEKVVRLVPYNEALFKLKGLDIVTVQPSYTV